MKGIRILIFGRNGQLGFELNRCLRPLGQVVAVDQDDLDLTMLDRIPGAIQKNQPEIIINAAAYTDVDKAESEESLARTINAAAPGVIAEEAEKLNADLIHFSSDYVFDGEKGSPYLEYDVPNPINVYGITKLEGESVIQEAARNHLILRTSWLYSMNASSFPTKVLKWARELDELRIVDDQIGSPTWARMLAETTALLIAKRLAHSKEWYRERTGIYHLGGGGSVSRYGWAKRILEYDPNSEDHRFRELRPASSVDFPTSARRPLFTALNCDKFGSEFGLQLPPWNESLKLAMEKVI